jgi:ankyrin repeat protein
MKHYSILDMFIDAGIDLDHVNDEGNTAMMMTGAKIRNSHNVMKLFLEAGAKSCFINNAS